MLLSSLGLLSVAVGTAVAATATEPSRLEVVRRAQQKYRLQRRQKPSAVPESPVAQCGSIPVGESFYLWAYKPDRDEYYYGAIDTPNHDGGFFTIEEEFIYATPYTFDIECNLVRGGSDQEIFFLAQPGISVIQVGNAAFRDSQAGGEEAGGEVAKCAVTDGYLTCGTPSIPTGQFCSRAGTPMVWFADANAMLDCEGGLLEMRPFTPE